MNLPRTEILRYAGYRGKLDKVPPELSKRIEELIASAPINPKSCWSEDEKQVYLVGTIGADFDRWQRKLAGLSATDNLLAQAIGAAAIECVMDELETRLRSQVEVEGKTLERRKSPGYGTMPLSLSTEILAKTDATHKIGVSLTSDCLLVPTKSVTAICRKN